MCSTRSRIRDLSRARGNRKVRSGLNVLYYLLCCMKLIHTQLRAVDHSARRSMKNAANCVKHGELQGFRNCHLSNAYCGLGALVSGPRLAEGLLQFAHCVDCRGGHDDGRFALGFTGEPRLWWCGVARVDEGSRAGCLSPRGTVWCLPSADTKTRFVCVRCRRVCGSVTKRNDVLPYDGPQLRRGYPPNLSISFSGGKETN